MIQGSFRNVGLKLPVDSPQDLQLKLNGFTVGEMRIWNWRQGENARGIGDTKLLMRKYSCRFH